MSPVFRHGRLRLYLLKLLDESPRHGYEVIRLLQDRFMGVYSPSPGTIYPRLARLEEEGLVTHGESEGRKVYRITDKGREELRNRSDDLTELEDELTASVRDIAREVTEDVRETVRSLREELTWAVRDIHGQNQARGRGRARGPADRGAGTAGRSAGTAGHGAGTAGQGAGTAGQGAGTAGRAPGRPGGLATTSRTPGPRVTTPRLEPRPPVTTLGSRPGRPVTTPGKLARAAGKARGKLATTPGKLATTPGLLATTPGLLATTPPGRGRDSMPGRERGEGSRGEQGWGNWPDWQAWADWPGRRGWPGPPGSSGWADPSTYRDLERLARRFTSELRTAATQAHAVSEDALGDLRAILDDALARIKSEIFGEGPHEAPHDDTGEHGHDA